ncbi:hypothetical protein REPUB_Repub06bG0169700 [Reevesia pubescens]
MSCSEPSRNSSSSLDMPSLLSINISFLASKPLDELDKDGFGAHAAFGSSFASLRRHKVATKPKPKVEDGIFGTSEGIGFTKKNELFVEFVAINAPRLFGYCIYLKVNVLGNHGKWDSEQHMIHFFALIYAGCTDFEKTNGGCVFAKSQHATFNCMWQQKQLFDNLDAMLVEESLLLRTLESTHLNSCQNVKAAASRILGFIEEFIPVFKKSKEFEKQLAVFIKQGFERSSILESVLSHFDESFSKVSYVSESIHLSSVMGKLIAKQFSLALVIENESENLHGLTDPCCEKCPELEALFADSFKRAIRHVMDVLQKLGSLGFLAIGVTNTDYCNWEAIHYGLTIPLLKGLIFLSVYLELLGICLSLNIWRFYSNGKARTHWIFGNVSSLAYFEADNSNLSVEVVQISAWL